MKAKTGVKKKFNINNEKKSITMTLIRLTLLFWEIYKDDIKLKNNIIIKNWSVKIEDSKTLKFRILNISIVSVLFNNRGIKITDEPFKKNKSSDIKKFFLKENTVSSFPKWYDATTRNINKTVLGNTNQQATIRKEISMYAR